MFQNDDVILEYSTGGLSPHVASIELKVKDSYSLGVAKLSWDFDSKSQGYIAEPQDITQNYKLYNIFQIMY